MNIRDALIEKPVQVKTEATGIAGYAASSKQRFDELMRCFLDNDYRVAQRAAWCVSMVARKNTSLIKPYTGVLIKQLNRKDVHDAVIRNSLRILQEVEIPEAYYTETINSCFDLVEHPGRPVAIKAFALTVLGNIAQSVPEIKSEIKLVIDYHIDQQSAGFKSRARRVLKQIGY